MARTPQELADEWLRLDKDDSTRNEINSLLKRGDTDELQQRLGTRIAFGTAGLRGPMKAGFACMNALTVIQASQGLAAYLLETEDDVQHRGIVIGRDARHNSEKFAKLAAAAFVAKGIRVWWYETPSHTPLVPFGVRHLNAVAGIMVTASHNPAHDNGYKVYWSNGCQIIPPHDVGIAAAILKNLEPVTWDTSVVDGEDGDGCSLLVEGSLSLVQDKYYEVVWTAVLGNSEQPLKAPEISFVYTPLHGLGLLPMTRTVEILDLFPIENMHVVESQAEPDPDFPTVKFPNPEENGALDLAKALADKESVSLILASDPDADRLAVAEKHDGGWHQYTGNQLGILLASYLLEVQGHTRPTSELAMLASTVSSRMLATLAARRGFHYTETLTGFKWLGNVARDLSAQGYKVIFAYEEALGYMIPTVVHDKDSISAAAVFLMAVAYWNTKNLKPFQKLQQLYEELGYFEEANTYLISPSTAVTNEVFRTIRTLRHPHPTTLGSRKILAWRDLTLGYDSTAKNHVPFLPVDSTSQMITCDLDDQVRFTVRGSGTEPKIKLYIECRASTRASARAGADSVLKDLLSEWFVPEKTGLRLA
ncbi:phosphoglucomutase-like protein [Mytilinidion resinicola]|uniref:Phosphoglucomutase-like protein n=1 Tax=Mytilinidion resinicola TaxID=574789 RepID=A0A6A6YJ89_9PEZI|nr:phosphoglucomutase-like protein [Mytilinidion resinicola]KAF2808054.1 phosphoglucomutase-like protein [Mytilinidion resinicola]